jgi:hypothetical protein
MLVVTPVVGQLRYGADVRMSAVVSHRKFVVVSLCLLIISVTALVVLGFRYWHESEYWLVGVPGFGTAIGTIGLAAATFRLIQREDRNRQMTLTALAHSQVMATEAARHRRDDRARLLRIALSGPVRAFPEGERADPLKDDEVFDLPADANRKLILSQVLEVGALDGLPITIRPNGLHVHGRRTIGFESLELPYSVRPGPKDNRMWFTVDRAVKEWVEIAEKRERGDPGPEVVVTIGVDDGFDDGVIDAYNIILGGCPLRRSSDRDGQWYLDLRPEPSGIPRIVVVVRPMVRHYFISKIGNQPLADAQAGVAGQQ